MLRSARPGERPWRVQGLPRAPSAGLQRADARGVPRRVRLVR